MHKTRILIAGLGSIGGIIAGKLLSHSEISLDLLFHSESSAGYNSIRDRDYIELDGSRIAVRKDQLFCSYDIPHTYDMIICVTKANDLRSLMDNTVDLLKDSGYFVILQNGMVEVEISDYIQSGKIIRGIVRFGGKMQTPGIYVQHTHGPIFLGECSGGLSTRLEELGLLLSDVLEIQLTGNIEGIIWSKLAINSTLNGLSAILGCRIGDLFTHKKTMEIMFELYREVIELGLENKVRFEPLGFDPFLFYKTREMNLLRRWIKWKIAKHLNKRYRNSLASTYQSILQGKNTEIPYINGFVVSKASDQVPFNQKIKELIAKIEKNELKSSWENLDMFSF